jgi:hypothetical protein
MHYQNAPEGKDPHLWHLARKRAAFKRHLAVYLIVNLFLWLIWYFNGARIYNDSIPWPLWTTGGWGIGLAFHYMGAYVATGDRSVDREYEKLLKNQQKQ